MVYLKLYLWDEGHLYINCSFYLPTTYPKCHLFQFLSRSIPMHIPIPTGVQIGHTVHQKDCFFLLKNVLFAVLFPWWRSFVCQCLFNILTIYPKCHCFHFVSRDIRMYIPILTGVQNRHLSRLKDSVFLLKNVLSEASFPWWRSFVCHLLVLHSDYLS